VTKEVSASQRLGWIEGMLMVKLITDKENEMADSVVVAAFLRGRAGKEEELARRLQALVLASRSDPGVVTYDLHHSTEDPALWFLYERYQSQEHFNSHRKNAVLRSFVADAATLLDGKMDIRTFTMVAKLSGG
jgi:quinol monooxygenase YgiN